MVTDYRHRQDELIADAIAMTKEEVTADYVRWRLYAELLGHSIGAVNVALLKLSESGLNTGDMRRALEFALSLSPDKDKTQAPSNQDFNDSEGQYS